MSRMNVKWQVIIAVEEKPEAIGLEDLRHRSLEASGWGDRGVCCDPKKWTQVHFLVKSNVMAGPLGRDRAVSGWMPD